MQGFFCIREDYDPRAPHQGNGRSYTIPFENFPKLMVGDQTGFETPDGKTDVYGLIIHARTFWGINPGGGKVWHIHCHVYMMNAGFPAIQWEVLEKVQRRRNKTPVVPRRRVLAL